MRRRQFIAGLGGAAVVGSRGAWAQQAAMPSIGYINIARADQSADRVALFREGLNEFGLVEGQNVAVDYRWADGRYDRLADFTADLIRARVTVTWPGGNTVLTLSFSARLPA
jgi:putative ABC transport system substrate-binding protein